MPPLSFQLRPSSLEDFFGQTHLIWKDKPLQSFIESGVIPSMIFWWPPGVWKTTMAHIISQKLDAEFHQLSWVTSKKDDLREIISKAEKNYSYNIKTVLFLDEIHRRNKAQQDALLPHVEKWTITLIWATTENPSFTINNALLSRSRIFVFEKLTKQEILLALQKNIDHLLVKYPNIKILQAELELISELGNWDLRNAYNILETVFLLADNKWTSGNIDPKLIIAACEKMVYHDRNGEDHYNIISAIHKSIRDSDGNAACYRVQRLLSAGEDPLYIARRLLRFASEDIGPADHNALLLANQTYDAISKIGMPECDVFLFQLVLYLAKAPKSNIAYKIAQQTKSDVEKYGNLPVPFHLRNAPTKLMKELGYGKGYQYAHDFEDAKVEQTHFPEELKERIYG